jgi:hypothetical protein
MTAGPAGIAALFDSAAAGITNISAEAKRSAARQILFIRFPQNNLKLQGESSMISGKKVVELCGM